MLELLRVCLLPWIFSNLISPASCSDLNGGDGISSISNKAEVTGAPNTTTVTITSSVTSALGNATCLSRTANYITHTLPQQCLRTDRVAGNATQNSTVTEIKSVNATVATDTDVATSSPFSSSEIPTANASDASTYSLSTTGTNAASVPDPSASAPEIEAEIDSPLDNAKFLSFEEWKKQNLAKSGQSPENIGNGRQIEGTRQRPINNALESYGEEGEIDLDFSGFGGESSAPHSASRNAQTDISPTDTPTGELAPALRSKDAGKTCKERTNYASFDCAANVLKSNLECKSSSAVLVENKDTYMLNTCSAFNKFFIVELCDNILIDTIVLANYEFFSSMFRHFRVSVSDRYPVKMEKWMELGTFEARNVREVQAFLVERPQIWARYLRIEFLSHFGSEYYCPVSLLRVHGTTMLEDYRHQEEIQRGDHAEEAMLEVEVNATPALSQEPATTTDEASKETLTAVEDVSAAHTQPVEPDDSSSDVFAASNSSIADEAAPTSPAENVTLLFPQILASAEYNLTCVSDNLSINASLLSANGTSTISSDMKPSHSTELTTSSSLSQNDTAVTSEGPTSLSTGLSSLESLTEVANENSHATKTSSQATANGSGLDQGSHSLASNTSTSVSPSHPATTSSTTIASPTSTSRSPADTTRQPSSSSSTVAAPPQPATQESFYKSVHKRLQQLESNSTLSLQYIEEQSRILRDAFSKVEKRQIAATTSFLSNLNSTVLAELQGFRQAYDQLWQSTVIELEGQREQYQREMLAMGTRLTLVADELVWQKRMGIVQSTLLLLCLGLVLFARQGNGYLEMPLMQQMVHRSQTALARSGWESPPASPSPNSRSPVSLFRHKLWRSHTEPVSGNVTEGTDSRPESKEGPIGEGLKVNVAPPTPLDEDAEAAVAEQSYLDGAVEGGLDEGAVEDDENEDMDEEAFEDVWESRSGPATPRGTREGDPSDFGQQNIEWLDPGASGEVVEGR